MDKTKKAIPFILPLAVYAFPAVFLYSKNVKEAELRDMLLPMLVLVAAGYAIFCVALCLYRNALSASIFSGAFGILLLNYSFFERAAHRLLPFMRIWQLLPIAAVLLYIAIAVLTVKKPMLTEALSLLLALCFACLIIVNLITALPTELSKYGAKGTQSELDSLAVTRRTDRPNIYYILMDEYASFYQCEQYLGYDNVQMKKLLDNNKFNISYTSFNDATSTEIVMTNALQLDYVANTDSTHSEMLELRRTAPLHSLLHRAGYTQRGVGSTAWLGIKSETLLEGGTSVTTADGSGFWDLLIKNTVLHDTNALQTHASNELRFAQDSIQALSTLPVPPKSSIFTMYYICSPHTPFFFKADGTLNLPGDYSNDDGKHIGSYIGQMQYLTSCLDTAVQGIIASDPDSIIVVCSDHGLRYDNNTPEREKARILNAVYYKGDSLAIEGKSTVNTLRLLLSRELNIELIDKEVPCYE